MSRAVEPLVSAAEHVPARASWRTAYLVVFGVLLVALGFVSLGIGPAQRLLMLKTPDHKNNGPFLQTPRGDIPRSRRRRRHPLSMMIEEVEKIESIHLNQSRPINCADGGRPNNLC